MIDETEGEATASIRGRANNFNGLQPSRARFEQLKL